MLVFFFFFMMVNNLSSPSDKLSTGSALDLLLEGGYETDCITTVYGPAGSGKTNLCLLAAVHSPPDKRVIYIDTEGSFSLARLQQLSSDWRSVLDRVIILQPTDFSEQRKVFDRLRRLVNDKISLIILDSAAMLYRLEIGTTKNVQKVNRDFGIQLAYLAQLARKKHIPILITNQVYADFEDKGKVKMVGGDLLKYASKCLIELQKLSDGVRRAVLKKHRSLPEGHYLDFRIVDSGLEQVGLFVGDE